MTDPGQSNIVTVEMTLRKEMPLTRLTEGYTREELRALRDHEPDALIAIEDEAIWLTMREPDDSDTTEMTIVVNGEKVER